MAAVDTTLTRVQASSTLGGTYNNVGYVRSFELTEGEDGGGRTLYFGGELDKAGEPTLAGSMPVLFDKADTTGQELIRNAKRSGATVFLRFCPEGTTPGSRAYRFEARVTEVTIGSAVDDDWVQGSFSFRGLPATLSNITLA
jgi:hypothetical protein